MSTRVAIVNGYVLSMDSGIGELERGNGAGRGRSHRGGRAATSGSWMPRTIDAHGGVVMPGFIDTHRHTWQTALRGICSDWTLMDYFLGVRSTLSPRYTAEDVYVGNYAGALEALDAGVTTILDFSHCNNTPEHADRAIEGLRDAGIRATFAYGYFAPPRAEPHFTSHAHAPGGLQACAARARGAPGRPRHDGDLAHRAGAGPVRGHQARGRDRARAGGRDRHPHGVHLGDAQRPRPVRPPRACSAPTSCTCTATPAPSATGRCCSARTRRSRSRPRRRCRWAWATRRSARRSNAGLVLSLSCDVISSNSGDMFSQMRLGLQDARALENDRFHAAAATRRSSPSARATRSRGRPSTAPGRSASRIASARSRRASRRT